MKIAYVTPRPFSLTFGGLEVQLLKTKKAVENLGITVETIDFFNPTQMNDIDIIHFFGSEYVFAEMADLFKAINKPYVVSPIFYPIEWKKLLHRISAKIPFSVTRLRGNVLCGASCVLPNSKSEAALLKKIFGIKDSQIRVIPNAVETTFVGEYPNEFRQNFLRALPLDEPFVLSVGRIEQRKNSLNLLRAAARIKIPIIFIGDPEVRDVNYANQFFKELQKYPGYVQHVPTLPPYSSKLANAYAAAHVHALVSWLETPGLASLEAGLNGANLVVGDCPPVREYFEKIAWLAAPDDIESIIVALEKALNAPRDAKYQSAYISAKWTWEEVGRLMSEIYFKLLNNRK